MSIQMALAAAALMGGAGLLGRIETYDRVAVPLVAEALPPEAMAERTVQPGEPFMVQRLTALKSATLQADLTTDAYAGGNAVLPKGTRLFLAAGSKGAYWCGAYSPGIPEWIGGAYKFQWLCLQDADGDQVFEAAYLTPDNAGAFLPSFGSIHSPRAVQAAYTADPEDARVYFETAVVHEKSFNIYNSLFFYQKARRPGDDRWSNIASITKGVSGGYTTVSAGKLPQVAGIGGVRFTVTAQVGKGVTVQPTGAPSGVVSFAISSFPAGF